MKLKAKDVRSSL